MTLDLPPRSGKLLEDRLLGIADLSELRSLAALAYLDGTTGLMNRRAFDDDILGKYEQANGALELGVVFLDLTGFKAINDGHSHDAGDTVLRNIGRALQGLALAISADAYRNGGDEFLLVVGAGKAASLASQAKQQIHALKPRHNGVELPSPRVSVGYALQDEGLPLVDLVELVRRADKACRRSKLLEDDRPVRWESGHPEDPVLAERLKCKHCVATTSVQVLRSKRSKDCLGRCGNCVSIRSRRVAA